MQNMRREAEKTSEDEEAMKAKKSKVKRKRPEHIKTTFQKGTTLSGGTSSGSPAESSASASGGLKRLGLYKRAGKSRLSKKNRVDFFSVGNKLDVEFLSTDQFRDYQTFLASLSGFFMHHCFATPEI